MKKTNYKEKSEKELNKMLSEMGEGLRKFRFGMTGSKTKNVKEGATLKKEIARLKTELNSRKTRVNG